MPTCPANGPEGVAPARQETAAAARRLLVLTEAPPSSGKKSGHVFRALHRTCVCGFVRTQALIARLELSSRSRSVTSAWKRVSCPCRSRSTERTIAVIRKITGVDGYRRRLRASWLRILSGGCGIVRSQSAVVVSRRGLCWPTRTGTPIAPTGCNATVPPVGSFDLLCRQRRPGRRSASNDPRRRL